MDVATTPRLTALARRGVWFGDNHATYPPLTMMNAATFATGGFPANTGFFGNSFWLPGPRGADSAGTAIDFSQPTSSEDYGILQALQRYHEGKLLAVETLFEAAQNAGLLTATVGKGGPAFMQDAGKGGLILDEKFAYPLSFAKELMAGGFALPKSTPNAYPTGELTLKVDNGDPTAAEVRNNLSDRVTYDPSDRAGTPYRKGNLYLMNVFLDAILPWKQPDLSIIWLRNPDSTEHAFGPGSANYRDALAAAPGICGNRREGPGFRRSSTPLSATFSSVKWLSLV